MIKSFQGMNLTQVIQVYLRVESSFDIEYRERTQFILRQLFDLNPIRANQLNQISIYTALDQSLIDLTQQILSKEHDQSILKKVSVKHQSKSHYRDATYQSEYRGVTRNGNTGWQIMAMVEGRQQFIATVSSKQMAAMAHDIVQMQSKGIKKIKANFDYTMEDIIGILIVGSLLEFRQTEPPVQQQVKRQKKH